MITFNIDGPRLIDGVIPTVRVEAEALPRVGDYVEHEASALSGEVHEVVFYWERGKPAKITVRLRWPS